MTNDSPCLLVLVGTKAQFIKTAPVLRELDHRKMSYRLVYTGQHSETFDTLEKAFGTRTADENLVPGMEAATNSSFASWSLSFWRRALLRRLRREWRGTRIVLVHGDTASTLYGALLGRLVGAKVAHIEAGLRSPRLLDPFPEELIRRVVSRLSVLHFPPDLTAARNLKGRAGRVVTTSGNTLRDALTLALQSADVEKAGGGGGYAIASIHRTENLAEGRLDGLMEQVLKASTVVPIRFVLHPVTRSRLAVTGWMDRLQRNGGVQLLERMDYPAFVRLMLDAAFLMTDGGSNQEEAAMLGLPTLLLRKATERHDGLGDNIVLSGLNGEVIQDFVSKHAGARWGVRSVDPQSPSAKIVDTLRDELAR